MHTIQTIAARLIDQALAGQNLSDAFSRAASGLEPRERAQLLDLSHGTLRRLGWYRAALDRLVPKKLANPLVDRLLLVALYQLDATRAAPYAIVDNAVRAAEALDPRMKALVNGVLRNFQRRREELDTELARDAVAYWNHPDWWIAELQKAYPKQWKAALAAANAHPPMTVRVNRRRIAPDAYLAQLAEAGIEAVAEGGEALRLLKPVPVAELPGFFDGLCSVQDAGAQLAADWLELADGLRVLDACAAPGGKSGHILERADVALVALDNDEHRLGRVADNLKRLGLAATLKCGDAGRSDAWWDGVKFDRVLADVPCSASGVARRHPDIKWARRITDIGNFARQQAAIADSLWAVVAEGGKMLYATCSIFPAENNKQIDAFLRRHPDATLERATQLLPDDSHDGFYYALLGKA